MRSCRVSRHAVPEKVGSKISRSRGWRKRDHFPMNASRRSVHSDNEWHAGTHDSFPQVVWKQETPYQISAVELNGKIVGLG